MESFAQWLTAIGLQSYAGALAENEVDFDVLATLTESDLQALGLPLGARKRLLQAAAKLNGQSAAEPTQVTSVSAPIASTTPITAPDSSSGERRQLTVMFCDLVGSTALSENLDPEELRGLLHNYRTVCGEVINRYEGYVARYVGDGILTYFGWPKAHEEDAERALRAALEIIQVVKHASSSEPLAVRIGIATGPVVVGEQAGVGEQSKLAIGSTPNLAARLQGLAGADQIVIASSTRRLVGNAFELADLGEHELKGIAEPVHAWRVQAASTAEGRFEARRGGAGLTPFVGREEEVGLLLARWQQACDGEGQVVFLCGEPGIGKSRITQTLRERIADSAHVRLGYQCSPYHSNSAFYPIIGHLERSAGFARDDSVDTKLDKLEALLDLEPDQFPTVAPLIAALLSLPIDRYPPRMLSPQKQKELTMIALADQVIRLAGQRPVLMIVEDVHWIDPSTLEMLNLMPERVRGAPVLMLLTHRPEFAALWPGQEHVTPLNLNRLPRRLGLTLVENTTNGKALPPEVLDQILAKTDGVPLFVEELTKNILESGFLIETPNSYELKGPLPALTIPSSLQDSLMARLDRLGSAKEIAQIGACIGREFSHELLSAVSPLAANDLQRGLQKLLDSGLVLKRGTPPEVSYSFKHAMVQDTAYESLLKSRRQALHQQLAEALEQRFSGLIEQVPELAARHYAAAGAHDKAVRYWLAAATLSSNRGAYAENISYANNGLEALTKLPESEDRNQAELMLQLSLGWALIANKGFASSEVNSAYERARKLCKPSGADSQTLSLLIGLRFYYFMRGELDASAEIVAQVGELAARNEPSADASIVWNGLAGWQQLFRGNPSAACVHAQAAIDGNSAPNRANPVELTGIELHAANLDLSSWVLWINGEIALSRIRGRQALERALDAGISYATAQVLAHCALRGYFARDSEETLKFSERTIAFSGEAGIPVRIVEGQMLKGWALSELGNPSAGIAQIEEGLAGWNRVGATLANGFWYGILSLTYRNGGRRDDAKASIRHALEHVEQRDERWWEAELHRIDGLLNLEDHPPNVAQAEKCFLKAVEVANSQSAKSLELRACVSLAKLWQSQGKRRDALNLLKPVYDWFSEGLDTKDLLEAKALLEELA